MSTNVIPHPGWRQGHCGVTSVGEGAACLPFDFKGSWTARTAVACIEQCRGCRRCSYVSFGAADSDCSWFARCDLTALAASPTHRTLQVRGQWPAATRAQPHAVPPVCAPPTTERVFTALVRSLLSERALLAGAILDVGANDGRTACLYASYAPERLVHAIDPSAENVALLNRTYGSAFPNLRVRVGGLGRRFVPVIKMRPYQIRMAKRGDLAITDEDLTQATAAPPSSDPSSDPKAFSFAIHRLDDIFADERLGFAHIDVEGSELSVLHGSIRTLARDQFVFSVEVHVSRRQQTLSLLQFVVSEPASARGLMARPWWRVQAVSMHSPLACARIGACGV